MDGEKPLNEEFPRLYRLSNQKEQTVNSLRENGDHGGACVLDFRRRLLDRELEQIELIRLRLNGITLSPTDPDSIKWRWTEDGSFKVRLAYEKWENSLHSTDELLGSLWRNLGPPKVEILTWLAVKERTITRSVLLDRNIIQDINAANCMLCNQGLETHNHLFLHCMLYWEVWTVILKWWQMEWACPRSLAELARWCMQIYK